MVAVLEALRAGRVEDLERIDRFILGTCRNVAHAARRRERRVVETRERLSAERAHAVVPPWELVTTRRVEECMAGLAPREARLLYLLYQEGATANEAAEILGMTPGNVRVSRHRVLARLRDCVERPVGSTGV